MTKIYFTTDAIHYYFTKYIIPKIVHKHGVKIRH